MIQTDRVRLGQYYQQENGSVFRVDKISIVNNEGFYAMQDGERFMARATDYSLLYVKITEQWLASLGFEQKKEGFYWFDNLVFDFRKMELSRHNPQTDDYIVFFANAPEMQFVHQLQDFFAFYDINLSLV